MNSASPFCLLLFSSLSVKVQRCVCMSVWKREKEKHGLSCQGNWPIRAPLTKALLRSNCCQVGQRFAEHWPHYGAGVGRSVRRTDGETLGLLLQTRLDLSYWDLHALKNLNILISQRETAGQLKQHIWTIKRRPLSLEWSSINHSTVWWSLIQMTAPLLLCAPATVSIRTRSDWLLLWFDSVVSCVKTFLTSVDKLLFQVIPGHFHWSIGTV